ncbi:MAG: type IV secretory system conjugative DNA transfer family protein [Anaerolineae bacterium]
MSFLQGFLRNCTAPPGGLILGQYGPAWLLRCRLPLDEFDTHMYVVGKTKKGKSKYLEHLAYQLISQNQGCAVIDPHADLADDLVAHLAPMLDQTNLKERIIYFDPSRKDWLLPFNVLSSPLEPYTIAQNVLEAFRRTWPESLREAPRFANIILAATLVLIANKLTLVEMPRLLTDHYYRNALLQHTANPEAIRFFRTRYDRWGREQAIIAESVLNKVGALTVNPTLRLILGQQSNALPFRRIMDEGKVLICNLGRVDGETRRLLGSLIVTGLEQAALSRTNVPSPARRPCYLIMDEFQDYVAHEGSEQTFSQILSECRKFGLHLIMAHQHLGQLGSTLQGALENAQLRVVFGVGRQTARVLVEEVFQPEIKATAPKERESLAEQWERFTQQAQHLGHREMFIQLPDQVGVRRLRTCTISTTNLDAAQQEAVRQKLARQSGKPVAVMRRALSKRERNTQVKEYEIIRRGMHV